MNRHRTLFFKLSLLQNDAKEYLIIYSLLVNYWIYFFCSEGDGKITFEELVVSIVKRKEMKDKDSELQKLFQSFDSDGDSALNKEELVALLNSLQEKVSATDIEEILADFDENETGLMQYNGEFHIKHSYSHL